MIPTSPPSSLLVTYVARRLQLGPFPAQPVNLELLGLHLILSGKGMLRIRFRLADPFTQHVLVDIQVAGSLRNGNAPILHHLTASSLNAPLNLRRCIPALESR